MALICILDPCKELRCGVNAICKVFFATGKAFCACPYLMVGDPYKECGKLFYSIDEEAFLLIIGNVARNECNIINIIDFSYYHVFQLESKVFLQVS